MSAVGSSETSVNFYQTTSWHIQENGIHKKNMFGDTVNSKLQYIFPPLFISEHVLYALNLSPHLSKH